MAIYHMEAKIVSRGTGRSAVAASAYMNCSRIYNDYDGIQHDYTRKQGLAWQQIFLPEAAPVEWADRATLWNAVEAAEKTKDSRLAREIILALPRELDKDAWVQIMTKYVQDNFTSEGMCVDVSIHNADEKNPHAHVLLTVRPLNADGTWQHKTEKEYLCVKDGEKRGFTAAEFRTAQADGWKKQYPYIVGKKKEYMTTAEGEAHGYKRASKYPKSTQYGRQNPISERWNSEEQLVAWRASWADTVNVHLERAGIEERIDHRSHAERGLAQQPTIHEGVVSRILEKMGFVSDRCEMNRQIREDNRLLRELRAAYNKLLNAVKATIPAIAEAMEKLRQKLFIVCYQRRHIQRGQQRLTASLSELQRDWKRYAELTKQIKGINRQRKALVQERESTSILNLSKRSELSQAIATLIEKQEELHSERKQIMAAYNVADDSEMKEQKKRMGNLEASLQKLEHSDAKYATEQEDTLAQYRELTAQAAELDAAALDEQRRSLRPALMQEGRTRLRNTYGMRFDDEMAERAMQDVHGLLGEQDINRMTIQERMAWTRREMTKREPKKTGKERNETER